MNRNSVLVVCICAIVVIGGCIFWFRHAKPHPTVKSLSESPEVTYLLLSDTDSGTTTAIVPPVDLIIELPEGTYASTSVSFADPSNIFTARSIQSYRSFTIVGGTIIGSGTITILKQGSPSLTYSFTTQ